MIFSTIVFLISCLLPVFLLIRDWKFSDKRTVNYRRATKGLLLGLIVCGAFSTSFFWKEIRQNDVLQKRIGELLLGSDKMLQNISSLSGQIESYQAEIEIKDSRIAELEQKSKILRTLNAKIECVLEGKWKDGHHPGRLLPMSWNKAQSYVQLLKKGDEPSKIFLYLTSLNLKRLPTGDLEMVLVVEAHPGAPPLGKKMDILERYNSIIVHLPFIHANDTEDQKLVLKELRTEWVVNGELAIDREDRVRFEIPIPDGGKLPVFQFTAEGLFSKVLP